MRERSRSATALAVLTMLAHIVAMVAHVTVENAASRQFENASVTAAIGGASNQDPQPGGVTDRHCHGCLSASMPTSMRIVSISTSRTLPIWPPFCGIRPGLTVGVDPPPPRAVLS